MELYEKTNFKTTQLKIKKLYCSNNLDYGLRLLPTEIALNHRYIQVNNDKAIMYLVIDLDHSDSLIFEKVNLPAPNFIVTDKVKNTSHFIYSLKSPIYKDYFDNKKALALFAKIQHEYTRLLQGDQAYVGLIAKNPLNEHWKVWNVNRFYPYDLIELADYINLPKYIKKREALGEGRNCCLFETVRKFAYGEILFYKANGATEKDFRNLLLNKLEKLNTFQTPLNFNELKAIAKSISVWTWKNFSQERFDKIFSKIQKARANKLARKRKEITTNLQEDFINELS